MTRSAVLIALFGLLALPVVAQFTPIEPEDKRLTSDIAGTVTDTDGRPLANVRILAINGSQAEQSLDVTYTNEDGEFVIEDLADAYWYISADEPNFAREWERERVVKLPAPLDDPPLEIELYEPHSMTGVVINEWGDPVKDAQVIVFREWLNGNDKSVQENSQYDVRTTSTDRDGKFTFDRLRPGQVSLVLEHPDYAHTRVNRLPINGRHTEVTILDGNSFHGVVRDENGPLKEVEVHVNTVINSKRSQGFWTVTTDEEGEFLVEHVPNLFNERFAHEHAVLFAEVDDEEWQSDSYHIYQSQPDELPEVTIEAWEKVSDQYHAKQIDVGKLDMGYGTVNVALEGYVGGGNRASRIYITSTTSSQNDEHFYNSVKVDDSGTATFQETPPGNYSLNFHGSGVGHYEPTTFTLIKNQTLSIRLYPGNAHLAGKILGAEGRTTKQYLSWFKVDPPHAQGGAKVYAGGTYELAGVSPGHYRLVYEGENVMKTEFLVELNTGDNYYDLPLPGNRIEGHLIGVDYPEDDRGMGKILIVAGETAESSETQFTHVRADGDGKFFAENLPPGKYVVSMRDSNTKTVLQEKVDIVGNNTVKYIELRLPENTGQIVGKVLGLEHFADGDRKSITVGAFPLDEDAFGFVPAYATGINHETGEYKLENLPIGSYILKTFPGFQKTIPHTWTVPIEVRSGFTHEFDIQLPSAREIRIIFETGNIDTGRQTWSLRAYDGTSIPHTHFIGRGRNNQAVPPEPFFLPVGEYVIESDFGDGAMIETPIVVGEGEGIQEFTVLHPALLAAPTTN